MSSKGKQLKSAKPQTAAISAAKPLQSPVKGPLSIWAFIVCMVLSLVFYGNTLQNGYSMDDEYVTLGQKNVEQGIAGIPAIFSSYYSVNAKQKYEYRPVVLASFALEYQFFGRNAMASHFINLLLYALTCFMLYRVLSKTFPQQYWLVWLSTLIFLIHPVHSEVVTSLKNRDEILAMLLVLCTWSFFLDYAQKRSRKYILMGILFMMLATLTKISCLPFMFIIPFAIIYTQPMANKKKAVVFSLITILVMGVCVNVFKMVMLGNAGAETRQLLFFENPLYEGNHGLVERLLMALGSFGFYVKMMLVPHPLVVYYGYNTFDGFSFGIYHVVGLLMVALLVWVFWKQRQNKPMVLGALIFVACISMFINLVLPVVGIVAERFVFAASAGFALLLAALLLHFIHAGKPTGNISFSQLKPAVKLLAAIFIIASAVLVIQRNKDWNSTLSIYQADISKVPQSAKLNSLVGSYYAQALNDFGKGTRPFSQLQYSQSVDSAIVFFRHALAVYPKYTTANNNLSSLYLTARRKLDSSGYYSEKALALDPEYPEAHSNRGLYYEGKAGIELEKAAWIKFLLEKDSSNHQTIDPAKLAVHDHYFEDLSQMKNTLINNINDISTGKYGSDGSKVMKSTISYYGGRILGDKTALFPQQYFPDITKAYQQLAIQNKFDRVPVVTDSVTAIYFNPILRALIGNESSTYANEQLYEEVNKKAKEYQQQTFTHINKSITLKNDANAFNRLMRILDKWKMYDELIMIHEHALNVPNNKKYSLEFNLANVYLSKNDYAKATQHAISGLDEINKVIKRIAQCQADFAVAGNSFTALSFDKGLKNMQQKTVIFVNKTTAALRQHGLQAEAVRVEQKYNEISK